MQATVKQLLCKQLGKKIPNLCQTKSGMWASAIRVLAVPAEIAADEFILKNQMEIDPSENPAELELRENKVEFEQDEAACR